MTDSAGRTAVVTGGSSGIGLGVARRLVADGFTVIISGRTEANLQVASASIGGACSYIAADLSQRAGIELFARQVLGKFTTIDALVNNAGTSQITSLETPVDELEHIFQDTIDTNIKSILLLTHALAPYITAPGGVVVNMSSVASFTGGTQAGMLAYSASKAGVNGLTMALARELAPRRITVNAVAPGMIEETGMTGVFDDARKERISKLIPLGRPGLPVDIAGAVSWLVSGDASYITGAIISVDGGWTFG